MGKKIYLATFEQVAADNGYEVFTAEEVAAYYKDGLQKSMKNELTSDEKELFAADIAFLQKAICIDENGKEVTRYFRPEQVNWEKTEDGVLLKGIAGVFADTPTNRKLNRVSEAFVPSPDFMKSLDSEEIDEDIIKAMRTGRYADTPENRRLHRVGQPYAKRDKQEEKVPSKIPSSTDEITKMSAKGLRNAILGVNNIATNIKDNGDHFKVDFDSNDFNTHGEMSPKITQIKRFLEGMGASVVVGKNSLKVFKNKKDNGER